jgi:hypothetical protein
MRAANVIESVFCSLDTAVFEPTSIQFILSVRFRKLPLQFSNMSANAAADA